MTARRLSPDEREQIYERRIRPDLLAGAMPVHSPLALFVAGQPGAGVPYAAASLHRELALTAGAVVQLSDDRLRAYHPAWRASEGPASSVPLMAGAIQSDVTHWFDRIVEDAKKHRYQLLVEDELSDHRAIEHRAVALRQADYLTQAVFVNTHPEESTLTVMARYDLARAHGLPPRFVPAQEHDVALSNLRAALGLLEDRRAVDGVRLINRDASQLYENRLVDGEWRKPPRAQESLDLLREKPRSPKDLVKFAMRWETLARQLAHDPAVPRDVASQALIWRNEAIALCESTPAAAPILQWAREGAAFRVMDRFEFEREFPHHARAVGALAAAVLETEKFDATEKARFLASARENIAQRIERGDMARIAARELAAREKAREKEPPTR
jgi:hypothetical protein